MGYFKQLEIERGINIMGNAGIDYGRGMTNIDHETGIRYGVISMHEVTQAWYDSSEANFGCEDCDEKENGEDCCFDCSPMSYDYDGDGYSASCGEDGDIFILKSPFYTYCQFCSPCAPGAGYLLNFFNPGNGYSPETLGTKQYKDMAENAGFIRAYCFGHDWFEDNKAPYPVFSVATGELISCS